MSVPVNELIGMPASRNKVISFMGISCSRQTFVKSIMGLLTWPIITDKFYDYPH